MSRVNERRRRPGSQPDADTILGTIVLGLGIKKKKKKIVLGLL